MAMKKPVITTQLPGLMKEFGEDNSILYVSKPENVLKKASMIEFEDKWIESKEIR